MLARDFSLFRMTRPVVIEDLNDLNAALARQDYRELSSMERIGDGFVPPMPRYRESHVLYVGREDHQWNREFQLGDTVGCMPWFENRPFPLKDFSRNGADALVLLYYREEKSVIKSAIRRTVDKRIKAMQEEEPGRKVYRKERNQIFDDEVAKVLPHAQSNLWHVPIIFLSCGLVLVGAVGSKAEKACNALRNVLGTLPITPVRTKHNIVHVMTAIAKAQAEQNFERFQLTDDFQMQGTEEHPPVARCKNTDITDEHVQGLLEHKVISHAAMLWDAKIRFKTDPKLTLRKVTVDDAALYQAQGEADSEDEESLGMADYGTLLIEHDMFHTMLNELMELLGGEEVPVDIDGKPVAEAEPVVLYGLAEGMGGLAKPEPEKDGESDE